MFLDEIGDLGARRAGEAADVSRTADLPARRRDIGEARGRARRCGDEPRSQGRWSPPTRCARISSIGWTPSPCICPRCASAPRTSLALAEHFLQLAAREFGRRFAEIAPETVRPARRLPMARQRARAEGRGEPRRAHARRRAAAHLASPAELVATALSAPPAAPRDAGPESARRDPDAGRDRAGAHPPRARDLPGATARSPHSTSESPARRWRSGSAPPRTRSRQHESSSLWGR